MLDSHARAHIAAEARSPMIGPLPIEALRSMSYRSVIAADDADSLYVTSRLAQITTDYSSSDSPSALDSYTPYTKHNSSGRCSSLSGNNFPLHFISISWIFTHLPRLMQTLYSCITSALPCSGHAPYVTHPRSADTSPRWPHHRTSKSRQLPAPSAVAPSQGPASS